MINYRSYKYLIKPTSNQKEIINKTLDECTYVYNKFIEDNGRVTYRYYKAKDILAKYRNEESILVNADSSAIMNMLFSLQDKRRKLSNKKRDGRLKAYTTSNLNGRQAIYFVDKSTINIPRLGNVKIVFHRDLPINSKILKATISIDNVGDYFISISFSYELNSSIKHIDVTNSIGLDYSSGHFYIDSNGNKINMRHYYQEQERRISTLKRALQKCRKGSKNYYKLKDKIGKIYRKTKNQRLDFLHKLSADLANKYDVVCVESIDLVEISKNYHLGKNTYDNSYGTFIEFLKYKLEDKGKVLVQIDKYYPSSKRCNCCGYINNELSLSDREWTCPKCNTIHDRDINAAKNIKERGIQEFTSIGYLDNAYKIGSIPH